ncbi:unnamed protein product [Fraxinus pennsylvanica]|uniref:Reverse transcriptase Ty1/copia-type domain-containing protein n=1 Tax=Fraxinus pennsylvanica TaxID=56036 RepID=A0AAD2DLZ0_9LAMI|nr:unnamed protein product [Fraxinus pennsylvanica]
MGDFIFLVLYIDDSLLASSDLGLFHETKKLFFGNFDMKDLGETSYVLGIEIYRDRNRDSLRLSQKVYIRHVLERFNMQNCTLGDVPIIKGDTFKKAQCPRNELERESIKMIPYTSVVRSLMYAQVCTKSNIAYAVSVLSRFQSILGQEHWKVVKIFMRYLKKTESCMLTFQCSDHLEVVAT